MSATNRQHNASEGNLYFLGRSSDSVPQVGMGAWRSGELIFHTTIDHLVRQTLVQVVGRNTT